MGGSETPHSKSKDEVGDVPGREIMALIMKTASKTTTSRWKPAEGR
jgi:hypothetical protein